MSKKNVIIGQYKTIQISIPSQGIEYGDDASTSSVASKEIGTIDISFGTIDETVSVFNSDNFDEIGLASLDSVFCPYVTSSGDSLLPYWELPTGAASGDITAYHLNPFNPNNIYTSGYVDSGIDPQAFYDSGHNIQLYNSWTSVGLGTNEDLSPHKALSETRSPQVKNVRSVGLRSPIILTGWGYDTDGNPVPSSGDVFHPEAFNNPNLWKSGPVDLRWNDTKKIWQAGSSSSQVVRFQITDTNSEIGKGAIGCDSVTATVLEKGCGMTALATGDSITVYDPDFAYFNIPIDLLVGMYGYASEMQNPLFGSTGVADCEAEQAAQGNCYWCVTSLSCAEEEIVI